jgi:hypothetical protein
MQKEFLKSCEGFLRAGLTEHGHPGPVWKIAKKALFDQCMEFENVFGPNDFIQKNVSGSIQLRPSAYLRG